MFGLFKKKSPIEKLQEEYQALQQKAFELSKINRAESDKIQMEAQEILKKIEQLQQG